MNKSGLFIVSSKKQTYSNTYNLKLFLCTHPLPEIIKMKSYFAPVMVEKQKFA